MILSLSKHAFACLIFILFNVSQAFCQVVINEIAPSNISLFQNANGNYNDWVEIYNSGNSEVNLSGYGLTDDVTSPYKFNNTKLDFIKKLQRMNPNEKSKSNLSRIDLPINQ